jgi:molybdopterin-binding protein
LATDGAQGALRTYKKAFAKLDIIASTVSGVNAQMTIANAAGATGLPARQETSARDIIARMRLSARNRLVGIITEIKLGDIMAHVTIKVGEHPIEAVITRRSAEEMSLHLGDTVAAVIKSTEVMVEKA